MGTLSTILSTAQNFVQTGPTLRDYQHARKIFTPNQSAFLPKSKNFFHIYFELDPVALASVTANMNLAASNNRMYWNPSQLPVLGVLVKNVKLPDFKFDIKKNNQYNRWNLTPTKVNYESVSIDFWDDTIDLIRGFWYSYYQYMIQDPNYVNWDAAQTQGIPIPTQWTPSTAGTSSVYTDSDTWGGYYGLDTPSAGILNRANPFFRSIRVYQFNRSLDSPNTAGSQDKGVRWTEYVLVNPIISSFNHDNVDFSTSEYQTNKMTVEYETVLYNSGLLFNDEIASWDAVLANFFDNTPSPNGGVNVRLNSALQTIGQAVAVGNEINQVVQNPSGSSLLTVLSVAGATSGLVNDAAITAGKSKIISVPTVVPGFGAAGLPPGQQ